MKKVFLAMFAVCAVSTLSGCVVSPGSYDNVELIQCAQRGKVIFRRDSFGLCGEELAARLNKGTITQNDMIAGGMGTQAAISRESALIQANGNVAAGAEVENGLQTQSVGLHRD
ncbi:hypothetical protein [Klebsiella quasipneumoniae]|jgi:hypothetical protein|uniref:hypothetical protein n=1 Tax=Klebsiella quasipneumoniae TaxID=1463165 RepID=UPI001033E390|nr:hypothetical protein [Klebsiella quasipneumoniae]HCI4586145.1 hypothetical protein [Klebsiella quasipneumoniae subsp. quasipneumoniae]EIY4899523.1 hypothetical protein [Klebsiella quasipneumoniae]EIY5001974.1 hypothetical protein [Klebsiella quasipneumoniae]MBC4670956.1 hypothetical protein [Klebsiella quasipneumoniae]MBC4862825.1 hypothetical protein [Klebsiella quasipneumoniae]